MPWANNDYPVWSHTGGGCGGSEDPKYPCDDAYEFAGYTLTVYTTTTQHCNMPDKATLLDLRKLRGVKPFRVLK